jgi:hypothetical protein
LLLHGNHNLPTLLHICIQYADQLNCNFTLLLQCALSRFLNTTTGQRKMRFVNFVKISEPASEPDIIQVRVFKFGPAMDR